MSVPAEGLYALITAILLAGPMLVLWGAFLRTRGVRFLFAALGFSLFFATDLVLFAGQVASPRIADLTEFLEFAGDLATAACFAVAFLVPSPKAGAV